MTAFLAAAVQLRSGMTAAANEADASKSIRQAAARGARYVQTPEMTNLLVRDRASLAASIRLEGDDPTLAGFRALAAELGIVLHVGSLAIRRDDGRVANRAFLIGRDGNILARYDKIHMFDADLANGESWRESATYAPGESAVVASLDGVKLGLAICYDLRFPTLFRAQAQAGAAILTVPAAFTRQTGLAHWHVLLRARAIENGAFVIAAAQGGTHEDGRETFGHSLIVDPWGRILAEAPDDEPGIVLAEIDPAASAEARRRIPALANERPFAPPAEARS